MINGLTRHFCMRRNSVFVVVFLMLFPSSLLFGEAEAIFSGAPRNDDGRFTNPAPAGELSHGTLSTRFPFMLRRMGTYFRSGEGAPMRVENDGAFLRDNARHSVPTVTWVGHATLLVQLEHVTFLTDPTWSNRPSPVPGVGPKRFIEPGIAMDDLPPIDFVLISHNHYDHLDLPTLRSLAERNANTVFYVALGNGELLNREGIANVQELDWGQTATFQGVTVHCLPSQHWSKRSLTDDRRSLW